MDAAVTVEYGTRRGKITYNEIGGMPYSRPFAMKRTTLFLLLLPALATGTTALYARQAAKPAAQSTVKFESNYGRDQTLPSGEQLAMLTGDVVIRSKEATLSTQTATYNSETQIATSPTRLRLDDPQNTLLADKGVAYYSTRDADFTGNVVINARPKQSGSGTNAPKGSLRRNFKDPVTITCTKVRYNWRTKIAVLTGNLTIKQKDRVITGDRGLYDGIAETVTLVGNIKSRRPTGEKFDVAGAKARAIAHFNEANQYFEVFPDPDSKPGKAFGEVPVRERGDGELEVIDSVETPTAPVVAPSPTPDPLTDPPEPTAPPTPNGVAKP
ncbi:MAG: LPS export ABC transporter periplasmic protein LptC [Armatimonadetes bacterium]|nr:LPS export ABC transporter periplasmic protein LptC [Armatimonadota bacterium]